VLGGEDLHRDFGLIFFPLQQPRKAY